MSTSPLLVRVAEINESLEQNGDDIKVGDEIFLREVSMQHVRLCLEENYNNPGTINCKKNAQSRSICFRIIKFFVGKLEGSWYSFMVF